MSEEKLLHNSHNPYYRYPTGACPTKGTIHLAIDVNLPEQPLSVSLRLWQKTYGEKIIPFHQSIKNPYHYYGEITTPNNGCLLWYYFEIQTKDKLLFYGNNPDHLGGEGCIYEQAPPSFQITVYRFGSVTPEWFKHSVMYQIFPDRFYRQGDKLIPKKNAVYHADWHDQPYYYKDPDTKEIISYDFFGGNIAGIKEKLSYLKELGISVIYLNPVFESSSNHRYDTGNYHQIDPILGTNEEFADLCASAKELGIHIIIDGVFSHTGSDSIYFNRNNTYPSIGAFQSKYSPYYNWYAFRNYPYEYDSWWGFPTLPNVIETTPSYENFIINGENSVIKHWLKNGISGWRLDVIDELPQDFSRMFYKALKKINDDAVIIGEVWEDASNKVSYGVPREYLCGYDMDSAMNYPFRKTVLDFLLGYISGERAVQNLTSQKENYPMQNYYAMMNLVSSHDVERVITLLGEASFYDGMPAVVQARYKLDDEHYRLGMRRSVLAALLQLTFPGVPSIYYGDEIGMQGFRDPYNRGPYEWDSSNTAMRECFTRLIKLRNEYTALQTGELLFLHISDDVIAYMRCIRQNKDVFDQPAENDAFVIIINRSRKNPAHIKIDLHGLCYGRLKNMLSDTPEIALEDNILSIDVNELSGVVLHQVHTPKQYERSCGILLHPTSLYSPYGIGDFGQEAFKFIDWLQTAKQKYWQVLPLNPVGYGASPYQSPSAFAGNYLLISPDELIKEDLLESSDADMQVPPDAIDFTAVQSEKDKLLRKAFIKFSPDEGYEQFCSEQKYWLNDYALYSALKKHYNDVSWTQWPDDIKFYNKAALNEAAGLHADEINYIKFVQYIFFKQWKKLKCYANTQKIKIIGDLPIFPSHDSADVWSHQELFNLNADGSPKTVAGVPPDYFSENGQLWGNPHYHWDIMAKDNYNWWVQRFRTLSQMVDTIRIDHFRGFAAYWSVDGKAENAKVGEWIKGPGLDFFKSINSQLGSISIIAEDLGLITPDVEKLKHDCGFPGMKVLQFELYPSEQKNIGFVCSENNIVYTGTHDNDTTIGWIENSLLPEQKAILTEHLHLYDPSPAELCGELIKYAYASDARLAVLPLQDVLKLDSAARMNQPGTVGKNWGWHLKKDALTELTAKNLADLCDKYKR